MKYVYIKTEVKKNDTTAMATATNEACIGWLVKNCHLIGEGMALLIAEDVNYKGGFLVGKMSKFFAFGCYSPPSSEFPIKVYGVMGYSSRR